MPSCLTTVIERVNSKAWKREENKRLLNIVSKSQLNLEPMCVYGLDQLGLNHLEIIQLSGCVGKRLLDLSTSDLVFLNHLQSIYHCVFNYDEKQGYNDGSLKRHPVYTKLNGYVSCPDVNGKWLRSSALLQLSDNYQ